MNYTENEVERIVDARNEIDKHIDETNRHFKDKKEFTGVYLILSKYVIEWTSLEIRIGKLLNNAYLYGLIENEDYDIIFNAIDWLVKEKKIFKRAYPGQADEFNSYLNCLNEYKKILEATIENGFSYYDNLVIANIDNVEEPVEVEAN